jgi:hypothetical protein
MFNETKRLGLNIVFEKSLIRKLTSVLLAWQRDFYSCCGDQDLVKAGHHPISVVKEASHVEHGEV